MLEQVKKKDWFKRGKQTNVFVRRTLREAKNINTNKKVEKKILRKDWQQQFHYAFSLIYTCELSAQIIEWMG